MIPADPESNGREPRKLRAARPPRRKWLLMLAVAVAAASVLVTALRARPDIDSKTPLRTAASAEPTFQATLMRLDAANREAIQAAGLAAAPQADTLAICRRLSLALVGSGMSLEEIRALEQIPPEHRVVWWTEHLLGSGRWNEYFGQRLARAFVGTHQGPFLLFRRRKFNTWLSEQLEKDVPYDEIVRQMIASEGLWTDTPAVNFVTATMDEAQNGRADPVRLAGRTSRAFLAMRIDCLQCHDDVLQRTNFGSVDQPREGTQHDFHALAAFYSGAASAKPVFRGIIDDRREYEVKFLGADDEVAVPPAVPFLSELLPDEGKPRKRLAAWVTHRDNRAFARATVNRIWALMFGRPLVEPVDDIPLVGDHPEMLEILATDFSEHGFQLRRLIRLIAASAAFQRDSRAEFEVTAEHERAWACFPLVQLRPDQVASSISQACKLTAIDDASSILVQLKAFGDGQDFLKRFGDRGEDEFNSDPVTIGQRLLLMNGNMVAERTKVDLVANAGTRIASFVRDDSQAVDIVFLSVLNRYPTSAERAVFTAHLAGKKNNARARALGDMTWAMLNATEFAWNH